jgi:multisubunit Na+/H+ antiporter MnhG subunit
VIFLNTIINNLKSSIKIVVIKFFVLGMIPVFLIAIGFLRLSDFIHFLLEFSSWIVVAFIVFVIMDAFL